MSRQVAMCMRSLRIHEHLMVLLCCLVLVYGLVASSLLVECMPGDGSCLVELIGCDPCQHPFGETGAAQDEGNSTAASRGRAPSQSCVDMSLDHYGISPSTVAPRNPLAPSVMPPALAAYVGGALFTAPGAALVRPSREPATIRAVDSSLQVSLRI